MNGSTSKPLESEPFTAGDSLDVDWWFEDGIFVLECVLPSGVEGEVDIRGTTHEAPVEERIPVRGTSGLKGKGKKL